MATDPLDIVRFWRTAGPKKWFAKDDAFDDAIRLTFEAAHFAASRGEHDGWIETADGALALILLLDQFPRNLFRDSGHAFATDPLARKFARQAVERGHDRASDLEMRPFFYLPFAHSEDMADQDVSLALNQALADEMKDPDGTKWAGIHRDIIVRFGRFPHRNQALGRDTTPEEKAFLDEGGFSG
jgi:uncharacterized protein (DUF924 family)